MNAFYYETAFSNFQILKLANSKKLSSQPMTSDQLKDIKERTEALRRYL